MSTPKISCIVPVYNVEKYLRRCVDSILAQMFTDFELILVDDGSPDGCPAICDEYAGKDSRVRVIHQANAGVSAARNAGLNAAQGEYVCFVDSDDWVESDYMKAMYDAAVETGADIIICGIKRQKKNGEFENLNFNKTRENICFNTHEEFLKIFTHLRERPENAVLLHSPVNKLYKYRLLNGIRFDESMKLGEDYCFNLDCFTSIVSFASTYLNLYNYRFLNKSAVNNFEIKKSYDGLSMCIKTVNFYKMSNLDIKPIRSLLKNWIYTNISGNLLYYAKNNFDNSENYLIFEKFLNIKIIFSKSIIKKTVVLLLYKLRFYKILNALANLQLALYKK